jgi:hypothetical protein
MMKVAPISVAPANAGAQCLYRSPESRWVLAFAGTTGQREHIRSWQTSPPLKIKDDGEGAGVSTHHVRINIETLQLHGYNSTQQQRFLRALETQLAQRAATQTDWRALASRHIAQLAPLQVRAGTTPEQAAAMLAEQLILQCTHQDTENHDG